MTTNSKKTERVYIRMNEASKRNLQDRARAKGMTVADYVRMIIDQVPGEKVAGDR